MKLHGVFFLTLILVVIVCEGVRKRQDRRHNKKLGPHQRQLAQEQQQHPQQQRRPRRQQQKPQRQQQLPQRQPRQQQQKKKGQGRGRPRPVAGAARRPRVGPPAAAIGSNLPDLKKLPNTKFECDESKR